MFSENKIKISFFYNLFSIFIIIFLLSYKDLNNFHESKIQLIFFALLFIISVFGEDYKNNIFLKILIFHVFIFYILRIPLSIFFFEGQFFDTRGVTGSEIKNSLFQLNIQYLFLFLSILIINPKFNYYKLPKENFDNLMVINFILKLVILIMICNVTFNTFGTINYDSFQKYFAVIFNIFNSKRLSLVFTVLVFLVIHKKYEVKYFYYKIFLFYGLYFYDTIFLAGSRSSLLHIILTIFLLLILYLNFNKLSFKQILFAIILIPIVQLSYLISTLYKNFIHQETFKYIPGLNFHERGKYIYQYFTEWNLVITRGLSERLGYLDFYIEKLSNKSMYEGLINFSYYFKSTVDRITPGIDFFNVPLATKAFQESYSAAAVSLGRLKEPWIIDTTNSEQITIFAEMQILFSYFSIAIYLILFLLLKVLLKNFDNFKDIHYQIVTIFILTLFFDLLTGFGLDFFAVQTFYSIFFLIIIIMISKIYLIIRK